MSSLYIIDEKIAELILKFEEGIISKEVFDNTLEMLEYDKYHKIDNICKYIKQLNYNTENIEKEIQRLEVKKKQNNNLIKKLRDILIDNMNNFDKKTINTELFKITKLNSEKLVINNIEALPVEFLDIEIIENKKIKDKKQIMEYIKQGNIIDGVEILNTQNIRIM